MNTILDRLSSHDSAVLLIMGSCFVFAVLSLAAGVAIKVVKSNNQTKLKQEMLARGMSAEEIKAVLDAGHKD